MPQGVTDIFFDVFYASAIITSITIPGSVSDITSSVFEKSEKLKVFKLCEGDIPTMISMHVLNKVTNQVGFQANPSRIDVENSKMVLAHCTLPLSMVDEYKLDTHFESQIGVAIKGELKEEVITIFKLSKNLKDYFVTTGKIIRNLNENNLCDLYISQGEKSLCKTCRLYPRHIEEFEGVKEITLSVSCPEVARILMERKTPVTFLNYEKEKSEEEYEDFDLFLFSMLQ